MDNNIDINTENVDEVRSYLETKANRPITEDKLCKALFFEAAMLGRTSTVELLLDKGIDINTLNEKGETVLHLLALSNHTDLLELLLQRGDNVFVNRQSKNGRTALHWAVLMENVKLVELLLKHGASVDMQDKNQETALYIAVERKNEPIVKLLIDKDAVVKLSHLYWVIDHFSPDSMVDLLLQNGEAVNDQDKNQQTALHLAVWKENKYAVECLLQKGADVNAQHGDGRTALSMAVWKADKSIVELLLKHGASIDMQNKEEQMKLYWCAIEKGHTSIVNLFLQKDNEDFANIQNQWGARPLHRAAATGSESIVKLLLEQGVAVNAQCNNGSTALHWAAENGNESVVKLLLQKDARVNIQDKKGRTALHLAYSKHKYSTVSLFARKGHFHLILKDFYSSLSSVSLDHSELIYYEQWLRFTLEFFIQTGRGWKIGENALFEKVLSVFESHVHKCNTQVNEELKIDLTTLQQLRNTFYGIMKKDYNCNYVSDKVVAYFLDKQSQLSAKINVLLYSFERSSIIGEAPFWRIPSEIRSEWTAWSLLAKLENQLNTNIFSSDEEKNQYADLAQSLCIKQRYLFTQGSLILESDEEAKLAIESRLTS